MYKNIVKTRPFIGGKRNKMLIWDQRGNLYKLRGSGDTLGNIRNRGMKQIQKTMNKNLANPRLTKQVPGNSKVSFLKIMDSGGYTR